MDETLTPQTLPNHNTSSDVEVTIQGDIPMAQPASFTFATPTPILSSPQQTHSSSQAPFHAASHPYPDPSMFLHPIPIIEFQLRDVEPQARFWATALVGHYVGRHNHDDDIQARLEALWGTTISVRRLADDVLIICVLEDAEADRILGGSPWELPTCFLFLQLWEGGISPSTFEINHVPTWVQVKGLPLEFWPYQHLAKVLKPIGTLVCIGHESLAYTELRWLRALVMVDLTKIRLNYLHVQCGGKVATVLVTYMGNHRLCIRCGGFGHHHNGCGGPPGAGRDWSRNFRVPDNGHLSGNANDGEHDDSEADAVGEGGGDNQNVVQTTLSPNMSILTTR